MKNPPNVKILSAQLDGHSTAAVRGGYRQSQAPNIEGRLLTDEQSDDDFSRGGGVHVPRNPSRNGRTASRDERRLNRD